jgi:hypothetical protein
MAQEESRSNVSNGRSCDSSCYLLILEPRRNNNVAFRQVGNNQSNMQRLFFVTGSTTAGAMTMGAIWSVCLTKSNKKRR